ncbi:MAG: electron transporter RnfE [Firmicutes bacterium HGW-Firmicutes-10]|jgi:electron transport complex protein RnfE|nr:electron transport complex subunit RsxE [Erysipelotrichaceae bacterium]PKM87587.1 MAG: electron transporter RnfE [Firmicutes bacterium HGW-Firmicutes-10]
MNRLDNFKAGFIRENPVFALYLGLCSVLAISTTLNNAVGMGAAVIAVLTLSNVIIAAMRKITPDEIRIPVYIVVIATLVKIAELLIQAYATDLYVALGVFIPLIVVNCIILGRAEAFASKNTILDSAIDGIGMGLGYTVGLILISVIRQVLSSGIVNFSNPFTQQMIFEVRLIPQNFVIAMFSQPTGAFLTFAVIAAGVEYLRTRPAKKTKEVK